MRTCCTTQVPQDAVKVGERQAEGQVLQLGAGNVLDDPAKECNEKGAKTLGENGTECALATEILR